MASIRVLPDLSVINCCQHPLNFFGDSDTEPMKVIPADPANLINLDAAAQGVLAEHPDCRGFTVVEHPRFAAVKTKYVPKAGDDIVVSALSAKYIRDNCPEYDEVGVYSPDSDKRAVRNSSGQIIGTRSLVYWPVIPRLLPPSRTLVEPAAEPHPFALN